MAMLHGGSTPASLIVVLRQLLPTSEQAALCSYTEVRSVDGTSVAKQAQAMPCTQHQLHVWVQSAALLRASLSTKRQRSVLRACYWLQVLWGECIAGALYMQDFLQEARAAGFVDARVLSVSPVSVDDPKLLSIVGDAKFYSISYRLFKLPGLLEESQEDYGQQATYQVRGIVRSQHQLTPPEAQEPSLRQVTLQTQVATRTLPQRALCTTHVSFEQYGLMQS